MESGTLDCFRKDSTGDEKKLVSYEKSDAFGELALLYNAPR